MLAAARGSAAIVAMLVDRGADVNAATDFGNTALMYAAARGQVDAVRVLLQRGALSGHKNKYGLGFVDWAKWSDRESEILAMLETPAPV